MNAVQRWFGMQLLELEAVRDARDRIIEIGLYVDSLDIPLKWKNIFFKMADTRGLRELKKFEEEMIQIALNSTDALELFADGKIIGIEKLYEIAVNMDYIQQVDYYKLVKAHGVKSEEAQRFFDLAMAEGKNREITLLDFIL